MTVGIFGASKSGSGLQLWETDGTNTFQITDITGGLLPQNFIDLNGILFFLGSDASSTILPGLPPIQTDWQLWQTNGTPSGTAKVTNESFYYVSSLTESNGLLFFLAYETGIGPQLWKSDGTSTVKVADISGASFVDKIAESNGVLFFTASDTRVYNLWTSDGTPNGTVKLTNYTDNTSVVDLVSSNGITFFETTDANGSQIWKTNGTEGDALQIMSVAGDYIPSGVMSGINGTLFFPVLTSLLPDAHGQLWKSDGTIGGTSLLVDLGAGSEVGTVKSFMAVGNSLFFIGIDSVHGMQLWHSNGTPDGTVMLTDIDPGLPGFGIDDMTAFGDSVYFFGRDTDQGTQLWKSNGTPGGTIMVANINAGGGFASGFNSPQNLVDLNGELYFEVAHANGGVEFWKSDGTSGGTVMFDDVAGLSTQSPLVALSSTAPVAHTDTASVQADSMIRIDTTHGVLANDYDLLSVNAVSFGGDKVAVTANSPGVLTGVYGTLTMDADGSYSYIAYNNVGSPANTEAQDTFTYTAAEGHGGTATSTLTVGVKADPSILPLLPFAAFMAELAQAAYHLVPVEIPAQGYNNRGGVLADNLFASLAASDSLYNSLPFLSEQKTSQLFHFLTVADLSLLAPISEVDAHFPTQGLVDGIFLNRNAAALVGQQGDSVFVAFRGTNDFNGSLAKNLVEGASGNGPPDINDWYQMEHYYEDLNPLLAALDKYSADANNGVNHVYVTGHSLGAAMVQRYMFDHQNDSRFEAITFADSGFAYAVPNPSGKPLPGGENPQIINVHIVGDLISVPQQFQLTGQAGSEFDISHLTDNTGDLHDMGLYYQAVRNLSSYSDKPYEVQSSDSFTSISYAWSPIGVTANLSDPTIGDNLLGGDVYGLPIKGLIGSSYHDSLNGGLGNDTIEGGPGNDTIDGGGGINTAVYTGTPLDYFWHKNLDGSWKVLDHRGLFSSVGPDGIDTLINIQFLKFGDSTQLSIDAPNGFLADGYLSGSIVYADVNGNGQLDAGEISSTTDASGHFVLIGGSGPLIAFGGTDTSTGLLFKGQLSAPAGSTDITPLTTLLTAITSDPTTQQKILAALGLSSSLDLSTFDPIAAAQTGSADGAATELAGAKVYDTVEMIASALAGSGGAFTASLQATFSALASALDGAGINFSDKTTLSALITQVAQTESVSLASGVADTVASIIAAGNAALDHVLQMDQPGAQLLDDTAGIELVEQGAASTAITNAAESLTQLQAIANFFTGTNLSELISQGQSEVQNPGQHLGPIAFDGSATTDQNTVLNGTVSAIDLMGNAITYALDGTAPAGLKFKSDGSLTFDPGSAYKHLGIGESTTVSFQFTASDGQGTESTGTDTITINGLNDKPTATPESNGVAKGNTISVSAAHGVLANDSDPDVHDHLTVASVNGSAANLGHSVQGAFGTLKLNTDGSYSYSETAKTLPSQIFAQDTFTYTTVDGHGGSATSTLTFAAFDSSASYQVGSNTTLSGGNGKSVLDGFAGHDVLLGGNGPDVLIGGDGNALTGGNGPDQFVFRPNFGANTIADFDVKNDNIQFDKSIFASVSDILAHTSNSAQGAIISDAHGDTVTFTGVTLAQLQAHQTDFHLV